MNAVLKLVADGGCINVAGGARQRRTRQDAIDFARASIALEGLVLDAQAEALFARYVDGKLSRDELNRAVLSLAASYGVE